MNMTREEAVAKLLAHFEEPYQCAQRGDADTPLAATAFMHMVGDRKLLALAKVGITESNDFAYIYSLPELTVEELERCYDHALEDGLARVDPNPNHSFSLISVFLLCDTITKEAASKVKRARFHKKFPLPGAGWAELRIAAIETGGRGHAANPMGKTLLDIYKSAVSA